MKVILVSMPWGALERQALGISILKPLLQQHGIDCDIRYLTFPFAEMIGPDAYQWMCYQLPYTAFAGDWCFTDALYGATVRDGYEQEILRERWQVDTESIARIGWVRGHVDSFLDYALAAVQWDDYDLIGFTSTFEQNIASLALARRIRRAFPDARIAFGGANWEDEMGLELHRQFPFVDYVCSGEAEHSLPQLVKAIACSGDARKRLAAIPGIVYRSNGKSIYTGAGAPVEDLDALPEPDFSDYFRAVEASSATTDILPTLLFETSRGCWWGAKSHCTFCGLNGNGMRFRSKSQPRALAELRAQTERWNVPLVEVVDNILDMAYFDDFLPAVAEAKLGVDIFYEVKANLSRRHLRKLKAARVTRIQPGIESLSDHVLQLMRKGTTGLRNIQLLKWCIEYDVKAEWNLLYGFPGETAADYDTILRLLPAIRHFSPPTACGPMRLDRFSPYHRTPAELGVHKLRPLDTGQFLYPFDEEVRKRISYYFDFDYLDGGTAERHAMEVIAFCNQWQANPGAGSLHAALMPDAALGLLDTRDGARQATKLDGWRQAVYQRCDSLQPLAALVRHAQCISPAITPQAVAAFLDDNCARNLMVTDGQHYLATAVAKGRLRNVLEEQETRRLHGASLQLVAATAAPPVRIAAMSQ